MGVTVKKADPKQPVVIHQITVQPVARTSADIEDYRLAHRVAEYINNPTRNKLYDLYDEAMLDAQLTGVYDKRLRAVRNKKLRFRKDGKNVDEMDTFCDSSDLRFIRKLIFDVKAWGLSGLEFIAGRDLAYAEIPRKHIRPHLKAIVKMQSSNTVTEGGYYLENPLLWVVENKEEPLGFLLKAVPWVLYKRGDVGDWAQYISDHGQPSDVYQYEPGDQEGKQQLEKAIEVAAGARRMVIPSTIKYTPSDSKQTNSDGSLQEQFAAYCDQQISILVVGNTETSKSSSSSGYAQSQTHQEQQLEVTTDDLIDELAVLNSPKFLSILKSYGFPVDGGAFYHVEKADPSKLKAMLEIDLKLADKVPLADDYWYETYDRPKPENYEELKAQKAGAENVLPAQKEPPSKGKAAGQPDPEDDPEDLAWSASDASWIRKFRTALADFFRPAPAAPGRLTSRLDLFYASRCPKCGGKPKTTVPDLDDHTDWIAELAKDLHAGRMPDGTIPRALYEATAQKLMKGVLEGLGGKSFDYDDKRNDLRAAFEHNVFAFSAAKSFAEMEHFKSLLLRADGTPKTFSEFRNDVFAAGYKFNVIHLNTEYDCALTTATMAAKWATLETLPFLEYSTVGDDKVRPSHRVLDGFTAPPGDRIWRKIYPPNDWHCRCDVVPGVAGKYDPNKKAGLVEKAEIPKYFQKHAALDKVIFDSGHPVFSEAEKKGKASELTAVKNYGMKTPKQIYTNSDLPAPIEMADKDEFNRWWQDRSGSRRGEFRVKDETGNTVRFSDSFRKHTLEDNLENREVYAVNCEDVVKKPDEVWTKRGVNGSIQKTYIKYYDGYPMCVKVEDTDAKTMFRFTDKEGKINEPSLAQARRGILIYRKN